MISDYSDYYTPPVLTHPDPLFTVPNHTVPNFCTVNNIALDEVCFMLPSHTIGVIASWIDLTCNDPVIILSCVLNLKHLFC